MQIDAVRDALTVRVGSTFRDGDVERLEEAVAVLGPFSRLTIDFGAARQCDDAVLVRLARMLGGLVRGEVAVRGLTHHQWKLLTYLGIHPGSTQA
jgi:hypothetical protein